MIFRLDTAFRSNTPKIPPSKMTPQELQALWDKAIAEFLILKQQKGWP